MRRLQITPSEVSYVITKDGKIYKPDRDGQLEKVFVTNANADTIPSAEVIDSFLRQSDELNSEGGMQYTVTVMLLKKYRLFTLVNGRREELYDDYYQFDNNYKYIPPDSGIKLVIHDENDIPDILELSLSMAGQNTRRKALQFLKNMQNIPLSASLIRIINSGIDMLLEADDESLHIYGTLLSMLYIDYEYANISKTEIMKSLGLKANKFADMQKIAVKYLSEYIFGMLPGEGLLSIDSEGILHFNPPKN